MTPKHNLTIKKRCFKRGCQVRDIISNPYFQIIFGAAISFVGSVVANHLYLGKVAKKRAQREAERAYSKLTNRLMFTTITDINHPLHLLPLEIADRVDDLKFALGDVNPAFDYVALVHKAIEQAIELRRQQEVKYKAVGA
jgi:hypothetical protein